MSGLGADFAQTVLSGPLLLAAGAAALAGLVSFASPCVLPLVPGYVGYVTGLSGSSLKDKQTWRVVVGITLFVLGFTVVFVLLGTSFSALGALFSQWQSIILRVLGVIVILAGFVFMGGFGLLQNEHRIRARPKAGLWGAPVLGATFALGWAPCVGPTLSAVLSMSVSFGGDGMIWRGALLAFVYCLAWASRSSSWRWRSTRAPDDSSGCGNIRPRSCVPGTSCSSSSACSWPAAYGTCG